MVAGRRLLLAGLILAAGSSFAAEQRSAEQSSDVVNYAFASQLGSGIYSVNGRTVQIYRVPISATVRSLDDKSWGVKLTFPFTLGFYNFTTKDLIDGELPEDLETVSFVPGVEFEFPVLRNWTLMPLGEFGFAKDFTGGPWVLVYAGGVKSLLVFPRGEAQYRVGNTLIWVGATTAESQSISDDYSEFQTGFEYRHPAGFKIRGNDADLGWYLVHHLYLDTLAFRGPEDTVRIDNQFEIGATIGSHPRWKLWKFKMPRFGLGYRFGDDLSAVRIVFGVPF